MEKQGFWHTSRTQATVGTVTTQLPGFQTDAIAGVTAKRDLGLTGLLIILLQWGDT